MEKRATEKYVCIHGHFYQPPREDPRTEEIPKQPSAHPFHDWNERIMAEAYAPNTASHILDADGEIEKVANNYSRISFNFGPTLLRWMEAHAPQTYQRILEADRWSRTRFSGYGSAIAQAYHHSILPLANERDRQTEVRWGVADFEHRFGRKPAGMWLPEAAVDLPTLEALAAAGMQFTLLSPSQAKRVRSEDGPWQPTENGDVETRRPYWVRLPSGRKMSLFFYDGPLAQAVAFGDLLFNGGNFADRLKKNFSPSRLPQLVHIATDGETYGHHHRFGDMALAYALETIEEDPKVHLTIYEEFLAKHPPRWEVEIVEGSSWSCAHGIERWRSDCGCQTGGREGWNQEWRRPLRESLNWLRDQIAPRYEKDLSDWVHDPWKARDDYISVLLDSSDAARREFLSEHARRELSEEEERRVFEMLELQRFALMMFTSCGWFFNDLAGIETLQILRYAARAIALAERLFPMAVEERFLDLLASAKSNQREEGNGRTLYRRYVNPK